MKKHSGGRPAKRADEKIEIPIRALVTPAVVDILQEDMEIVGIKIISNEIRIAIYQRLERAGLMNPDLQDDPTWDTLKKRGLL